MKYINSAKKRARIWFWVALLTCIAFACGIVMIPVFATMGLWVLMAVGIAFCAHGFYGAAFYWTAFADNLKSAAFIDAIVKDGLLTVSDLSAHFGMDEKKTVNKIRQCIEKRFLPGYRFDGEKLIKIIPKPEGYAAECPYCGAKNLITEKKRNCDYCGSVLAFPPEETVGKDS